jgi:hypothetical protein
VFVASTCSAQRVHLQHVLHGDFLALTRQFSVEAARACCFCPGRATRATGLPCSTCAGALRSLNGASKCSTHKRICEDA